MASGEPLVPCDSGSLPNSCSLGVSSLLIVRLIIWRRGERAVLLLCAPLRVAAKQLVRMALLTVVECAEGGTARTFRAP